MYPIPRHLNDILVPVGKKNSQYRVNGKVCCSCGCECFHVKIYADTTKGYPQVCDFKNGYSLVVAAVCKDCGKEYLIFDASKHGWDGFVSSDNTSVPDEELKPWYCPKCNNDIYSVEICIMSQGKQDFIEEAGITDGKTEFCEDDWVEAFEWIIIGLNCNRCGHRDEQWIDYETM